MILATCQCQHIFCCWVEPSLLLSSYILNILNSIILENCETQPPASIGWVALSSVVVRRRASVTSPLISTIWCFRAYKPYIFCEDMILATCQCQHIFCCWVEPSLLLSSFQRCSAGEEEEEKTNEKSDPKKAIVNAEFQFWEILNSKNGKSNWKMDIWLQHEIATCNRNINLCCDLIAT